MSKLKLAFQSPSFALKFIACSALRRVAGALFLLLLVTGASAQTTVTVDPTGPQTLVPGGESLMLTATVTPASDGPFTYNWAIGTPADGNTMPEGITSSGETTAVFTITAAADAPSADNLDISLLVGTNSGGEIPLIADVPSVVVAASNQAPTAVITDPNRTVGGGVTVILDGSGSSDPDGDPLTYAWSLISGSGITLTGADTDTVSFTTPAQTTTTQPFAIQLIVTDDASPPLSSPAFTSIANITVAVLGANAPPVADAGEDQTVEVGESITLDGSGSSDPDGDTLTYLWTQVSGTDVLPDGEVFTSNEVSPTVPLTNLAAGGVLVFSLVVGDGTTFSDLGTVTITVTTNAAPTANAGADQTVVEGATVTLNGSGSSDPDAGDTLTYTWTQTSGTTVTLSDAMASNPTFTAPTGLTADDAELVFSLVVNDGTTDSAPDTVTITIVADPTVDTQKTVETINQFLETRNRLILANQPDVSRQINRLQQGVGTEQLALTQGGLAAVAPFDFNFLNLGSGEYKFSTSLDQVTRAAKTITLLGVADTTATVEHTRRRLDVWFDGSLHKVNQSEDSEGTFGIAHLGVDYLVSKDLLVGALLQYDSLSDSTSEGSEDSRTEGEGWMIGPYVTTRLQDNLYLDARLLGGSSDNDIRPPGETYTDSFTSKRYLASIGLTGEFTQERWTIRPNASLSYFSDKQKAYTNSIGGIIPSQTVSQRQLRFGPNISTQFTGANGWLYEPAVTLDGIYSNSGSSVSGVTLRAGSEAEDGWRARVESGLSMTSPGGGTRLSFSGNYDGIGQSKFESWGVGLNLALKF